MGYSIEEVKAEEAFMKFKEKYLAGEIPFEEIDTYPPGLPLWRRPHTFRCGKDSYEPPDIPKFLFYWNGMQRENHFFRNIRGFI